MNEKDFTKEIFGIRFPENQLVDVERTFEQVRFFQPQYDSEYLAFSQVYHHDVDDGLRFDYRYAIEAEPLDGNVYYSLYLVPDFESLTEEKKKDILENCCRNEDNVDYEDIFNYGLTVLIEHEVVENTTELDMDKLNCIASVIETIDSLRAFHLDHYQNRIGNTGWDYIKEWCLGIDSTKALFERWDKEKENKK